MSNKPLVIYHKNCADGMAAAWAEGGEGRGAVTADPQAGLLAMLTGMGSLSYGEMAGQRIKLGLFGGIAGA